MLKAHQLARPPVVVLGVLAAIWAGFAALHGRHLLRLHQAPKPSRPRVFAASMPARVLWAWEEPENLRSLPPSVGVAYLAETVLVGQAVAVEPRRQLLETAEGAPVMAVIRLETRPGFADSAALRVEIAARLAAVAQRSGIRALQLDFDALASEHAFYAGVLAMLRPQLPAGMPLSITALVSWCGRGSWLHGLPVDEAVPMLFRMGGRRGQDPVARGPVQLDEPLCQTSRGVATDEPWPPEFRLVDGTEALNPATRVYLFAPQPWRPAELAAVAAVPIHSLAQELTP